MKYLYFFRILNFVHKFRYDRFKLLHLCNITSGPNKSRGLFTRQKYGAKFQNCFIREFNVVFFRSF
jgi:hypothetical protein